MPRARHDYIPRPDGELTTWATQFWQTTDGLVPDPAIPQPMVDAVEAALAEFLQARGDADAARAAYESALQTKAAARNALESSIRPLARLLQALPTMTDATRAQLGLKARKEGTGHWGRHGDSATLGTGGGAEGTPTPALVGRTSRPPARAPLVCVQRIARFEHVLRLTDSAAPQRKAFPTGTLRAEIFCALGPAGSAPPTDPALYRYARFTTAALVEIALPTDSPGMSAHYLARWIGRGNTPGPWSEVASATVAA